MNKKQKLWCFIQFIMVAYIIFSILNAFFNRHSSGEHYVQEDNVSYDEYINRLNNGKTEWQRYNAATALGEIGNIKAVPYLINALKDNCIAVRQNAATSLGEMGIIESKEDIKKLLNDPSQEVKDAASWALELIKEKENSQTTIKSFWKEIVLFFTILFSLVYKFKNIQIINNNKILIFISYFAWFIGLVLIWLFQLPMQVSETLSKVGFPLEVAYFQLENGHWVDYLGKYSSLFSLIDGFFALFIPQIVILFMVFIYKRKRNS